jgi:uncharacterized protein YukE
MTTSESGAGYTVATAELRTHAGVLDQLAGTLGQCLSAAQQVTLSDDAYGQLPVSAAFAALVRSVASPGVTALTQAQSTLSTVSRAITATAANYDAVEQGNTGKFAGGVE